SRGDLCDHQGDYRVQEQGHALYGPHPARCCQGDLCSRTEGLGQGPDRLRGCPGQALVV
ncbi:hypothetical protein BGZ74_008679, partial [Mortierella antarctica]